MFVIIKSVIQFVTINWAVYYLQPLENFEGNFWNLFRPKPSPRKERNSRRLS